MAKLLRKVFIGIPSEVYRWLDAFKTLKGATCSSSQERDC